ncbi:MAG: hypothetical protein JXR40_13230 [Pontiellaceae bacterium]|nr:hypothetical protein [Pontiellaceae bacterium]
MILDNPARVLKRIKLSQKNPIIPTKAQFEALLSEIRKMRSDAHESADLCELLAYSGCRLREGTAIAGWLGHKDGDLLTAKTYGHLHDEHSAEMAKRMTYGA